MSDVISKKVSAIIDKIEPGYSIDEKVLRLTEKEIKRRINKHRITIRNFEKKYNMTFDEFQKKDLVNELGHSWDVEQDFFDWEMATTELEEFNRMLAELGK